MQIKKAAILVHRWMGVVFCLLFAWWFISGIFMMYWDYPGVDANDRLERAQPLDASRIRLSAPEAYARLKIDEPPDEIELRTFDGRPAYYFRAGPGQTLVYADTGQIQDEFPRDLTLRTAAAWAGQPASAAHLDVLDEEDQWTVAGSFRPLRPLLKYSWPDGEQVYVSEATGEVVQYTTRGSRLGAYLGAIPHWLYFTPLRKNQPLWNRLVIWSSGAATIVAIFGLIAGIWMYSPSKRYRLDGAPTGIPYNGQKRLHMILGLFFGVIACTWTFSGMLSMDPFPISRGASEARYGSRIERALRGGPLRMEAFSAKNPQEAIRQAGLEIRELEFASFAGEPVYIARESRERSRIIPVHGGPTSGFDHERIFTIVNQAVQPAMVKESRVLSAYDAYYLDRRHQEPLPVLLVQVNDAENSRFYIDPRTAEVVAAYSSDSWVTRWLYHGLHSINFPWLYNHRPAWDILVLALMFGGAWLSVTSVIIAAQVLRRKFSFRRTRIVASSSR